jgi:hypothetical protein
MEARVEIDRGVAHGVDEQGIEQRGLRTPKAQAPISGLGCRGERRERSQAPGIGAAEGGVKLRHKPDRFAMSSAEVESCY